MNLLSVYKKKKKQDQTFSPFCNNARLTESMHSPASVTETSPSGYMKLFKYLSLCSSFLNCFLRKNGGDGKERFLGHLLVPSCSEITLYRCGSQCLKLDNVFSFPSLSLSSLQGLSKFDLEIKNILSLWSLRYHQTLLVSEVFVPSISASEDLLPWIWQD